jgi:hypothetical protein
MEPMPLPITVFTAQDAMSLLDLLDKVAGHRPIASFDLTDDQLAALEKLRHAGKFYVPDARGKNGS